MKHDTFKMTIFSKPFGGSGSFVPGLAKGFVRLGGF